MLTEALIAEHYGARVRVLDGLAVVPVRDAARRRVAILGAMSRAAVVTIGNELVSGDVENTNGSWLARRLAELGRRGRR